MLLVQIDPRRAVLLPWRPESGPLLVLDEEGGSRALDIGGLNGRVKLSPAGKLVIRHESGVAIVQTDRFERVDARKWQGDGPEPVWDTAFAGYTEARLVDSVGGYWTEIEWDREALKLPDPGYTEVTDATILPGHEEIALNIVRYEYMAIFNLRRKTTELISLAGRYGNSHATVVGATLWCVNYDVLCAIDMETHKSRSSSVLQPPYLDPQYGMMTSAFIGEPCLAPKLGGWLVPRPYSGDILFVREDTLSPTGRIICGNKPYEVALFENGTILVMDHPFDAPVRWARVDDLQPI